MLDQVIAAYLETLLTLLADDPEATGLPAYVRRAFYDSLSGGILAPGLLRLGGDTCHQELLLPCSCKQRGFCPSCAGRRMAQTTAHLVERVIPWGPTRQWVVSGPKPCGSGWPLHRTSPRRVQTIIRPPGGGNVYPTFWQ